jgi:hypothetical protein
MRDIYDSSPAPVSVNLPASEPLHLTGIDFAFLAVSSLTVLVLSLGGWLLDGTVSLFIALGGSLVVFESWHTALMFLQRHQQEDRQSRIFIHMAALIPWVVVLGSAALAMMGLFWISDHWFS